MKELGCYGLPSTHNEKSEVCQSCESRASCRSSALRVAKALEGKVEIAPFMSGLRDSYALSNPLPLEQRVNAAPAKVRDRLRRLLTSGRDLIMASQLANGENPFPDSADICLTEMVRLLLAGGFSRQDVVVFLTGQNGWKHSSAISHVSNCLALLRGLGLIESSKDRVSINSRIVKVTVEQ